MTHAYDKTYLEGVMDNLGTMMDYGINILGLSPTELYSRFISSGVAAMIEKGHPRYLAGMSGIELASMATGIEPDMNPLISRQREYWAGWALAYLQWHTGLSFSNLELYGPGISGIMDMFNPYHEADISKFSADAESIINKKMGNPSSRLKLFRKACGLSQEKLSEATGISLRTIRAYEQNSRSLEKAEAGTLRILCSRLGCSMESILGPAHSPASL